MLQLQAGGNAEPTWKVNHSLIWEALLALALALVCLMGTPLLNMKALLAQDTLFKEVVH